MKKRDWPRAFKPGGVGQKSRSDRFLYRRGTNVRIFSIEMLRVVEMCAGAGSSQLELTVVRFNPSQHEPFIIRVQELIHLHTSALGDLWQSDDKSIITVKN